MAQARRAVTAILRDIDTIEKTPHLTPTQKQHSIATLKKELELATQPELDLTGGANGKPAK